MTAEQRQAEVSQWEAERSWYHSVLADLQERVRAAPGPSPRGEGAIAEELATAQVEFAWFRNEVEAGQRSAARAQEEVKALRSQVEEEERRAQLELVAQTDLQEELALAQRRLEVEQELHRVQDAQLHSVTSTLEALRQQLLQARRENAELKASLEQNQATLRRLRD